MADSVIDTEMIILRDNWPIDPNMDWAGPATGGPAIDSLKWHGQNVTPAAYPLGRKFRVWENGGASKLAGYSTFIYLQVGTDNPDIDLVCAAASPKR